MAGDVGILLVRVLFGAAIAHGTQKVFGWGSLGHAQCSMTHSHTSATSTN